MIIALNVLCNCMSLGMLFSSFRTRHNLVPCSIFVFSDENVASA